MDGIEEIDRKMLAMAHVGDIIEQEIAPQICENMRETAGWHLKANVYSKPEGWYKRTRNLEQSVIGAPNIIERNGEARVAMGIECTAEYAKYVEFGTGPKGSAEYDGHVSEGVTFGGRMAWMFEDEDGEIRLAKAQEPRPFMRPALYDNIDIYKGYIHDKIMELLG